ncbi:Stp1/IreP family PP2C-type Ser/Thr phosphatase [Sessilibacter corallicola]|uniref:Protein-serine/threonine phosphatase PrpC n=1 Tax=Sessilibacter corallicola TaxID=2904075 RepID=A0ABQ0A4W8_9GAMM|nr:Stp1/IreP family PP2C-type Ser/Thr phosphatase [Sessilibacter corallicola]MCE2026692.1 Stp1/IreP family PP2C-type Ser/Thr phosphatase [Sessilibacter corallicola]
MDGHTISININGKTDVGRVRQANEDDIRWYRSTRQPFAYLVIADGMGGYRGGAMASRLAVAAIGGKLEQLENPTFLACTPLQQDLMLKSTIIEALNDANRDILLEKKANPELDNMGTTVVMAVFWRNQCFIAHLGDSRAYLWDDQHFIQLTKDHSLVQEMIDNGQITEEEARTSNIRNQITRALGVGQHITPTLNSYYLNQSALIVLCSDGLTEYIDNSQLDYVLSTHRPALDCCYRLVADANNMGGKDNISVGIVEFAISLHHTHHPDNKTEEYGHDERDEDDITQKIN